MRAMRNNVTFDHLPNTSVGRRPSPRQEFLPAIYSNRTALWSGAKDMAKGATGVNQVRTHKCAYHHRSRPMTMVNCDQPFFFPRVCTAQSVLVKRHCHAIPCMIKRSNRSTVPFYTTETKAPVSNVGPACTCHTSITLTLCPPHTRRPLGSCSIIMHLL